MSTETKKLYRSRSNRLLGGVCGGLGDYFGFDPTVVRVVFVLGALLGFGSFFLLYIILFFIVPEEPLSGLSGIPVTPPAPPEPPQSQ
jgi:phage shock protein PspC (stress-responsive transcriptional regulator)